MLLFPLESSSTFNSQKQKESQLGDSLNHQGASTNQILTQRGEGCHPLLKGTKIRMSVCT